jgi:hypothetical protein
VPKPPGAEFPTGTRLVEIFKEHPDWVPGLRDPQAVYFLLSKRNFLREWYDNLLPAMLSEEPKVTSELWLTIQYLTCSIRQLTGAPTVPMIL